MDTTWAPLWISEITRDSLGKCMGHTWLSMRKYLSILFSTLCSVHYPIYYNIMQDSAIQCKTVQYSARQSTTVQDSALQCKTVQYSARQCKAVILWRNLARLWHTLAYSGILWHALTYSDIISASLITADGAYHCPVGSIWLFLAPSGALIAIPT